ncbi:MAG TPA: hypothetical protein VGU46_06135 [Acidobacteriaceae bacterium]|nr:hypothetical protein [Acidobacteriaceae bacterium]
MDTNKNLFGTLCRAAALSFLVAGSTFAIQAQQSASIEASSSAPLLMASASPLNLTANSSSSSSSSSSSDSSFDANGQFLFKAAALNSTQPPPRRYGRPRYTGGNSNADGSSKFAFMAGAGAALPVGNTKKYDTPSWAFQAGAGRNWSKSFGILAQFDYNHFGLQGTTLANQQYLYNYGVAPADQLSGLDGSTHVWSFTLNPTFTLPTTGSTGAYFVVGGGFYHKVTDFTVPATGTYCDYYYGCYQYQANETIDHYTSNAPGVNGGIGLTYKLSKFSNERLYLEARYVVVFNSQRVGYTAQNLTTTSYSGNNGYPANSNRTGYVPITAGIRF